MDTIKKIIYKYRIVLSIFVFLILSFGIYLFVSAEEDIYANKIEVKNAEVTIKDGTKNHNDKFDDVEGDGNDTSDSNKIVRNFDSIEYDINNIKLGFKDENESGKASDRIVKVDILVPTTLSADILEGSLSSPQDVYRVKDSDNKDINITLDGVSYAYYIGIINNVEIVDSNTDSYNFKFYISNINMKNGNIIKPIVRVRESTDENNKDLTKDDTEIKNTLEIPEVRVTAKDATLDIKLYNGTIVKKDGVEAVLPVGIALYLPKDENKGEKGLQIPSKVSFDLSITSKNGENVSIIDIPTIKNTGSDNEYTIDNLPNSYSNSENGVASISEKTENTYLISFDGLKYQTGVINLGTVSSPNNVNYISTKKIIIRTKRTDVTKKDINYVVSINGKSIDMNSSYDAFVGDYVSKVDFIDTSNIQSSGNLTSPKVTERNSAIYNYNEEFYIQNTIKYGYNTGDDLSNGLTNYLKIDNNAIKIVDVGNLSDDNLGYFIDFSSEQSDKDEIIKNIKKSYTIEYGIGEWNSKYFEKNTNAPSYCPTDLTKLTKEELMNYYGGPCIKEKSATNQDDVNVIKWKSSDLTEDDKNKIIAIKFSVKENYPTAITTTMRFKARVKSNINTDVDENDINLIGNTYQIVSRGMTNWETNGNIEPFYMYDSGPSVIPTNVSKQQSDVVTYTKLKYDNVKYMVLNNENDDLSYYGNSIIVSAVKGSISVNVEDKYKSNKTTIYSGQNDPVSIIITPTIYKSDPTAIIKGAIVKVTIPSSLELTVLKGDKSPDLSSDPVYDPATDSVTYSYVYSESDIKSSTTSTSGTIPVLKIHALVRINTPDNTPATVKAVVSGKITPNLYASTEIWTNTPVSYRTKTIDLNLRNTNEVPLQGKVSTNYIDVNNEYNYQMTAVNLTGNDSNMELLYILPYNNDGLSSSSGSNFNGKISIAISNTLPDGYKIYYVKDSNQKTLLNREINNSSIEWIEWKNYNSYNEGITAIKIVPPTVIKNNNYFKDETGITVKIKTSNNKEQDMYYNNFYILNKSCVDDEDQFVENCSEDEIKTRVYSSNVTNVSVYNRTISGYVFEDENYDGLYSNKESRLQDIIVQLYKTNSNITEENVKKPLEVISENDELIAETSTDLKGSYSFKGLSSGNYYVKYTFNCDKYTVTEKNKEDPKQGDLSKVDSDADMLNDGTCSAVSNIVILNNEVVDIENIDLGLRVRQDFDIKMNKYISNVTVTSSKGIQTYNYDKQSRVKIDVKNLKNTSFRVEYLIEIENSRYFPGTIGNIIESIPDGMTFNPNLSENDGWYEYDNNLYYEGLNKTIVMPGEKYYIKIVLDLVTDSGGDYINFVAARDLKIKPVITNFLEIEDEDITDIETGEGVNDNE